MSYPSSPDTSSPKKRSRSDTDEWNMAWEPHPELYMPDGTMVLLANTTVFRVYPGLLAKHSEVFRGMISLSTRQPPSAEMYDGCPLVRLSDDAEELAFFLESTMGLHDLSTISYFLVNQPTSFRCVAAVLRLATKYMVTPLRRLAIEHISRIIPTKFEAIGTEESHAKVFGNDPPHPFALIALFRECQLNSFLPWALYLACREGFEKLVSGASHMGQPIYLSEEDRRVIFLGWKKLRDDTLEIRRTTVMSCAPTCKFGACNNTLRMSWLDTAFHRVRSDALEQWKLFNLLARYDDTAVGAAGQTRHLRDITPCMICVASWLVREKQAREKVWENLPSYFELPSWEVLQEEERRMRISLVSMD